MRKKSATGKTENLGMRKKSAPARTRKAVSPDKRQLDALRLSHADSMKDILRMRLELAYKNGYINRIREVEGIKRTPEQDVMEMPDSERERVRKYLAYGPEKEVADLLAIADPNVLDGVLGKS